MKEFFIWILVSYGLMNIVVFGSIFNGFRGLIYRWGESKGFLHRFGKFMYGMITCPMCFSTWVGFFMGAFIYSPTHEILNIGESISWFSDGILSSGGVWIINSVVEWFEENRPNDKNII